jgi:hypothetical protein
MTVEHLARRPVRNRASDEHELARQGNRLGEALVRETALLRQVDELLAAWNGAEEPHAQRQSSAVASHAQSGRKLDPRV